MGNWAHELDLVFAKADSPVDLGRATLLVAHEVDPGCDVEDGIEVLDRLAEPLVDHVEVNVDPTESARVLGEHVFGEMGFHGNTADYFDPRNSLLHEVLARRTGIPITLGIVVLEVARRAGIPAFGIGFPGHFLVGIGRPERCVLLDPFHQGRRLGAKTLTELLRGVAGPDARVQPEHLRPVDDRSILIRVLRNLKHALARRRDNVRRLIVLDRLVVAASDPEERRDRGLAYLEMGCFAPAKDDFERYLGDAPDAEDADEIREVLRELRDRQIATN